MSFLFFLAFYCVDEISFLLEEKGQNNLVFAIPLQLGECTGCVDLLMKLNVLLRLPYLPEPMLQGAFFFYYIHLPLLFHSYCILSIHSQAPKAV